MPAFPGKVLPTRNRTAGAFIYPTDKVQRVHIKRNEYIKRSESQSFLEWYANTETGRRHEEKENNRYEI